MIVIIGSGPAGISAAIYIKRANIPVMIITNHKSSLVKAKSVENYYGTGKISGENLYYQGIASALELDIPIIEDEAVGISVEKGMSIEGIKDNYSCDAIVLATGSSVSKNYIPGVSSLEGKGVSFCATCERGTSKKRVRSGCGIPKYSYSICKIHFRKALRSVGGSLAH